MDSTTNILLAILIVIFMLIIFSLLNSLNINNANHKKNKKRLYLISFVIIVFVAFAIGLSHNSTPGDDLASNKDTMTFEELDDLFIDIFDYDLAVRNPKDYLELRGLYKISAFIIDVNTDKGFIIAAINSSTDEIAIFKYNPQELPFNLRRNDVVSLYSKFIQMTEYTTIQNMRMEVPLLEIFTVKLEGHLKS